MNRVNSVKPKFYKYGNTELSYQWLKSLIESVTTTKMSKPTIIFRTSARHLFKDEEIV